MDPLTHMVTGALMAQTMAPDEYRFAFALVCAGAGVVPDIDFLARKAPNELVFLKLHRGFTHSLFAVPIIAACAAASGNVLFGAPFWLLFVAAALGAMSHMLLDVIMHATGLQVFWPWTKKVSLHLVVGLNPLTSSARCGERSLGVCLRCTMHSAVLSPLVLLLWAGFLLSLVMPGPWWSLVSSVSLAVAGAYLVVCQLMRFKAAAVMRKKLAETDDEDARAELQSLRLYPGGFNPTAWIAVTDRVVGHRVLQVNALSGAISQIAEHGASDTSDTVQATVDTPTVQEFLANAVTPHATVYPTGERNLVVWRDLAFAFSHTVSLFAARIELSADNNVEEAEFRERWDRPPEHVTR